MSFNAHKKIAIDRVNIAFREADGGKITDANNVIWNGGYNSAVRLDAAKRLAVELSQTTVTFFDIDNLPKSLSIADAETVVHLVAIDFQTKFAAKQTLLTAIEAAVDETALAAINITI